MTEIVQSPRIHPLSKLIGKSVSIGISGEVVFRGILKEICTFDDKSWILLYRDKKEEYLYLPMDIINGIEYKEDD